MIDALRDGTRDTFWIDFDILQKFNESPRYYLVVKILLTAILLIEAGCQGLELGS